MMRDEMGEAGFMKGPLCYTKKNGLYSFGYRDLFKNI